VRRRRGSLEHGGAESWRLTADIVTASTGRGPSSSLFS
jgi:hypothetical protein